MWLCANDEGINYYLLCYLQVLILIFLARIRNNLLNFPTFLMQCGNTILRAISELATGNTTYTSDTGKSYEFNTATKLNSLLVKALLSTGQLVAGASYDLDFDHQFIETEKYDAKMTYKKFTGYSPGVAVISEPFRAH